MQQKKSRVLKVIGQCGSFGSWHRSPDNASGICPDRSFVLLTEVDMSIGEFCNREVIVVAQDCTVLEASRLMRQHHVGALVIVVSTDGVNKPAGVITDRDLVVEIMAAGLAPEEVQVGEVVTEALYSVVESEGIFETMHLMHEHGIRRLPVVDIRGELQGIVTLDDLVSLLAEEMNELSKLIVHEQAKEVRKRK
jgi:CBS domain-containing protein